MNSKFNDEKLDKMLHSMHKPDSKPFVFNAAKAGGVSFVDRLMQNKKVIAGVSGLVAVALIFSFLFASPISPWFDNLHNLPGSDSNNSDTSNYESSDGGIISDESSIISNAGSSSFITSSINSASGSKSGTGTTTNTKGTISNKKATVATINQNKALPKFKTYQEIIALLKTMKITYGGGYLDGGIMPMESPNAAPTTKDGSTAGTTAAAASDFSSTNTQVSGIEEGDIIKNDGKYLYIVNNNSVSIVNAYPVNTMKKLYTITLPKNEYIQEIYVKGNLLTIIGNSYGENTILPNPLAADINNASGTSKIAATWIYNKQMTVVHVYDITKRDAPVLKRDLSFDGYLVSSREKEGRFYLVTNSYITVDTTKDLTAKDVLPSYSDSAKSASDILIPATGIAFCPENISANYLMISCFDIDNTVPAFVETVLGAGNTIYMSNNALYIVQPFYRYNILPVEPLSSSTASKVAASTSTVSGGGTGSATTPTTGTGTGSVPTVSGGVVTSSPVIATTEEGTVVMKFSIVDTGVKFTVAGEVPGQILNQYSMDEYAGTFRIATTKWGNLGSANNLYNLNTDMKVIGKIENLAPGERIYAVRFTEKTGYIVTFRQVDPLFVIDLSIPSAPKVVGELKIPGFSNYLHPVSSTLLLGIGQNVIPVMGKDSQGNEIVIRTTQSGLKVSLFDVSNPLKPAEVDTKLYGGPGSNSEAQYNPRAFVWWNSKSTALFPAYLQGADGSTDNDSYGNAKSGALAVSVDAVNGKLVEKARLFPENAAYAYYTQSRAVYIENTIYLSMNSTLYAFDATTKNEIDRVGY
jgi:inhibitor of cysteine peptidase